MTKAKKRNVKTAGKKNVQKPEIVSSNIFDTLLNALRKTKKREITAGIIIYTAVSALYFCVTLLPLLLASNSLLGDDSAAQYYPFIVELKRCLTEFFNSFSSGSPSFPVLEFNYAYGCDIYTTILPDFLPYLPYYIFSVFVPYESLDLFYGIGTIIFTYLGGLSFLYLCRYFRLDMLTSGVFAPFYVFSGSYFFTLAYNQHFLLMPIAFPLLIVGIDKIINRRSPVLFILAVFWLSLSGYVYLIYIIPFVVVFAIIRVRFVYKEKYFSNLGTRFAVGFGSFLLGVLMAAVMILPCLAEIPNISRSGSSSISLIEMFIPSLDSLKETLIPSEFDSQTGIAAACIPFLIFLLTSIKGKTEEKIYSFVMLFFIVLPVIRYGLNGFNYSLVRWGFIPAALFCFVCIRSFGEIGSADKKQTLIFVLTSLVFTLLITMNFPTAAIIFLIAAFLLTSVPFLRKLLQKLSDKMKNVFSDEDRLQTIKVILIVIISLAALLALIYCMMFGKNYIPALILSVILTAFATRLYIGNPKIKNAVSIFLAASLVIVSAVSFSSNEIYCYKIDKIPDYYEDTIKNGLGSYTDDNSFGRIMISDEESFAYSEIKEENSDAQEEKPELQYVDENENENVIDDLFFSMSLRENIPDIYVFKSVQDKDLIDLQNRLGLDKKAIPSIVEHSGFSGNEALYSLFGVRYMLLYNMSDHYKDINYSFTTGEGKSSMYFYTNERAFPIGVTYSAVSDKERFDSFDPASLPYAMMNEVYLENYPGPITADNDLQYSSKCDSAWEKILRGTVSFDIECHDNNISIDADVSDSFLFLTLNGVECRDMPQTTYRDCYIQIDGKKQVITVIHNSNSSWPWHYTNDHYTIPLGYFKDDVSSISFISPFNFKDGYVSAVPASVYEQAYESTTKEILTNTELSANKLTGNITVSQDKILSVNLLHNDGWKAYVDNVETPIYKANGLFLGIPLNAGTHDIRLEYSTPLAAEGLIVSLVSIAAFIVFAVVYGIRQKKPNAQTE